MFLFMVQVFRCKYNMDYEWIIWMIGGLCVLFTVLGGWMCFSDDQADVEQGVKLLAGWWGGVAMVVITTLTLTFVVKPVLSWFFSLF